MTILPRLVNISPKKVMFTPKYVDLRALSSVVASRIYALFVVKSTRVPRLGGGGSSQSWQCQDFHGFCCSHPSLSFQVCWFSIHEVNSETLQHRSFPQKANKKRPQIHGCIISPNNYYLTWIIVITIYIWTPLTANENQINHKTQTRKNSHSFTKSFLVTRTVNILSPSHKNCFNRWRTTSKYKRGLRPFSDSIK